MENESLRGQVERLTQKTKLLEEKTRNFRVEIANN